MRSKSDSRRTKIDDKNEDEKKKVLMIILEPSWADLGSFWVPSLGRNRAPALGGDAIFKNHVFEKIRLQDATWTDLGPILGRFGGAKRLQNGGQGGQKVR